MNANHERAKRAKWFLLIFALLFFLGLVGGCGSAYMVMLDTRLPGGNPFMVFSEPSHSFYDRCLQTLIITVGSLVGFILVIVFRRKGKEE